MSPFKPTKSHILALFVPLQETSDLAYRNTFFNFISPSVRWTTTGSSHSLAGTHTSLAAHIDATFNRLGTRLRAPIKFVVQRVVVDAERSEDGWWVCVETRGETMRNTGKPYNNEYIWLMRFDDEGVVVEIRGYFDTKLAEEVLAEPEPEDVKKESD